MTENANPASKGRKRWLFRISQSKIHLTGTNNHSTTKVTTTLMVNYLLQGAVLGLAAAAQPGPFQVYLLSQVAQNGWRRTMPAALAPLVSDGPIILLGLLVLNQVPEWMQRGLSIAGGLFILYLALGAGRSAWQQWRKLQLASAEVEPIPTSTQSLWRAALMNALNPNPYIYWSLVTGPILLRGWEIDPIYGVGFVGGFYGTMVASLAGLILVFGQARRSGPRLSTILLGFSAILLAGFGAYQLWLGIAPGS
jgi:threonine/homoserine/homoserine lactone efflux protein